MSTPSVAPPARRCSRLTVAVLAPLLALAVLAGCGSDPEKVPAAAAPTSAPTTQAVPPTTESGLDPDLTYVAMGPENQSGDIPIHAEPRDDAEVTHQLPNPWVGTSPLALVVQEQVGDDWWKVELPVRPNGSTGYVHSDDVVVAPPHAYRIEVHLSEFRLVAYNGQDVILETQVAVPADATPIPVDRYYITELLGPFTPDYAYGTYAYGLSGFSDVHLPGGQFGEGQFGIHGTNAPHLIGQKVSNGCIRMRNEDIEQLVPLLPLGVPVEILA